MTSLPALDWQRAHHLMDVLSEDTAALRPPSAEEVLHHTVVRMMQDQGQPVSLEQVQRAASVLDQRQARVNEAVAQTFTPRPLLPSLTFWERLWSPKTHRRIQAAQREAQSRADQPEEAAFATAWVRVRTERRLAWLESNTPGWNTTPVSPEHQALLLPGLVRGFHDRLKIKGTGPEKVKREQYMLPLLDTVWPLVWSYRVAYPEGFAAASLDTDRGLYELLLAHGADPQRGYSNLDWNHDEAKIRWSVTLAQRMAACLRLEGLMLTAPVPLAPPVTRRDSLLFHALFNLKGKVREHVREDKNLLDQQSLQRTVAWILQNEPNAAKMHAQLLRRAIKQNHWQAAWLVQWLA